MTAAVNDQVGCPSASLCERRAGGVQRSIHDQLHHRVVLTGVHSQYRTGGHRHRAVDRQLVCRTRG